MTRVYSGSRILWQAIAASKKIQTASVEKIKVNNVVGHRPVDRFAMRSRKKLSGTDDDAGETSSHKLLHIGHFTLPPTVSLKVNEIRCDNPGSRLSHMYEITLCIENSGHVPTQKPETSESHRWKSTTRIHYIARCRQRSEKNLSSTRDCPSEPEHVAPLPVELPSMVTNHRDESEYAWPTLSSTQAGPQPDD